MAKIPVRFMQGGGNGVSSKPEEKKLNVISTGYGDVDADAFKAFISDPRNLEAIYDRYKGFDGSKIRGAVSSKLLEMANSFMKGDMKFDESTINRYLSNNNSFASDGKTKKRIFTGNYSHKDQNTVNSLAARMMLDIINDNIKATSGKKAEVGKANEEARKKAEAELEVYKPEEVLWDSRINNGEVILTGNREGNRKDIQAMIARDLKRFEDPDFVKGYTPESIEKAKTYYNDLAKYLADDRILSDEDYIRTFKINNPNIHRMLDWKGEEQQEQQQDPMAGLTEEQKELAQKQKDIKIATQALDIRQGIAEDEKKLKEERRSKDREEWKKSYMSTPDYSGQYATYTITRDPSIPEDTSDMYKNWTSYMIDRLNDKNNSSFRNAFTNEINNYFLNGKLDFSKFAYKNDQTGEVLFTPSRIDQLQPFFNNVYSNNATGMSLMSYPNASGNVVVYDTRSGEPAIRTMSLAQAVRNNMFTAADADAKLDMMFDKTYPISNYDIEYDKNTGQFSVVSPYFTQVQENAQREAEKANGSVGQMRNGGIVKMQQGGNIDYSDLYKLGAPMPVGDVDISEYYTDEQNKHYNEFKRRKEKDKKSFDQQRNYARARGGDEEERVQHALKTKGGNAFENIIDNGSDKFRLASALLNLASLAASVSGFTPASTSIGVLGTSMNVLADWNDDSISKAQAIKNAAINLGLDAVSLIPYAGMAANASKTAKAIKTASKLIGSGSALFASAGLLQDSHIALNALQNKDVREWNNQDVTAMLNIASMLMKGGATGINAKSRWNTSRAMKSDTQQYAVRVSSKNLSGNKNKIVLSEDELKKLDNMRFEGGNPNGKLIGSEEAVKAQKKFIMNNFDVKESDLDFNTPIKFTNDSKGRFKGVKDYFGTSGRVYERNLFSPTNNPNSTGEYGLKTTGNNSISKSFGWINRHPFILGYDPTDMSRHTRKDYVRKVADQQSETTRTPNTPSQIPVETQRQAQTPIIVERNGNNNPPSTSNQYELVNDTQFFKEGGRIKRVKLKNGGCVHKLQEGGGQWANGRPRGTYYDDGANYFDIWYNTTGKALEDGLAKMLELKKAGKLEEWNAARKGIMKSSRDIQSSYKGMNKQTGWGFNSTGYTPVADITKQHQDAFDKDFRSANENIWAYQGIHRRGNTGDNESSANKSDGINSVYTSMRTYGYTNDNQAQFEGDERFKRIQQLANENNLVYEPWKDIAEGKENWYVFSDRPNANPLDLKPLNPALLKPENPTPGKFDEKIYKPGVGVPVRTDPADLQEKQPGTPGGSSPLFGDLLSGAILAGTLATNKKAFYKLDTPLLSHPLFNAKTYDGYYEKDIANREANKVRLAGRRFGAETADIDRYTANSLAGESIASDLERKAGVESANKYDKTTERAINTFNTNATMSADTFNKNISSIVGTKNANKQLRGNYLTAQWEGAWKPFLNEMKGNWLQNQRARRLLDQERFMKTDYADYLKNSWDAAYKEAGITNPDNMNQQYLFENNRKIYDKHNRLNTNYYYANAPIYRQQNPLIMFRSGGRVTTRVTRKIDNDSFMKEFGKNDRESKKDFTKRFLNLSTGALTLHSASRKDRLELFNYLKNIK